MNFGSQDPEQMMVQSMALLHRCAKTKLVNIKDRHKEHPKYWVFDTRDGSELSRKRPGGIPGLTVLFRSTFSFPVSMENLPSPRINHTTSFRRSNTSTIVMHHTCCLFSTFHFMSGPIEWPRHTFLQECGVVSRHHHPFFASYSHPMPPHRRQWRCFSGPLLTCYG